MHQQSEGHYARGPNRPLHSLGQYATAFVNAVAKGVECEVAPYNLTIAEFALIRLFLTDEEWTAAQLSRILPVDGPAISRLINKLTERELLYRRRTRSDRRIVLLRLTEKGKTLGLKLHRRVHAYEDSLRAGIAEEELESLRSAIIKILDNHDRFTQRNGGQST